MVAATRSSPNFGGDANNTASSSSARKTQQDASSGSEAWGTASAAEAGEEVGGAGGLHIMPLVRFLRENADRKPGWHRNQERRARGAFPLTSLSSQLEPWERQLARM